MLPVARRGWQSWAASPGRQPGDRGPRLPLHEALTPPAPPAPGPHLCIAHSLSFFAAKLAESSEGWSPGPRLQGVHMVGCQAVWSCGVGLTGWGFSMGTLAEPGRVMGLGSQER